MKQTGLTLKDHEAASRDDKELTRIAVVHAGHAVDHETPRDVTDAVRERLHKGQRHFEASDKLVEGRDCLHPSTRVKSLFIVWTKNGRAHSGLVRDDGSGETITIE